MMILDEKKTNEFGEYLRKIRKNEKGMSLRDFAELTGVSFSHLSKIERGEHTPSKATVEIIADVLKEDKNKLLLLAGYAPEIDSEELFKGAIKEESGYDSLAELKKLVEDYGIEDIFFHNIEDWRYLTEDDIQDIKEYIEFIQQKAKKRQSRD